ncbi:MAG TPA: type II secretion system protein [Sulfurimonas sp.]|nr:type II secretion system protein [Sulfurimonas sp.]
MKKGFTMIELIFVIVILGILAAVAIPKLAATRDDAKISKISSNLATLLSDAGSYYTSQGEANWETAGNTWAIVTNVELDDNTQSIVGTVNIESAVGTACFEMTGSNDGNLTIKQVDTTGVICNGAALVVGGISSTTGVVHQFGGVGVVR